MSENAPAIPLFTDAYLSDTHHLTLEEHGAYLKLMMVAWRSSSCTLPDDDARIARILGVSASKWSKLKPAVMEFWTLTPEGWSQKRLQKERAFVEKKREQNSRAAKSRWQDQVIENIEDGECERISERNAPPPPPNKIPSEAKASSGIRAREKTKISLPENWLPEPFDLKSKSRSVVDGWPPGAFEQQLEHFTAHHRKNATRFVDWQAAWATWVLNSEKFGSNHNGAKFSNGSGKRGPEPDGFHKAIRKMRGASFAPQPTDN